MLQEFRIEMSDTLAAAFFGTPESSLSQRPRQKPGRPSLLTVDEAAEYLGMSAKWLYRNYQNLPHVKIGGGTKPRIRFKEVDLAGWVAARTIDWRKQ
jgi:excisionase family DNA binding protein